MAALMTEIKTDAGILSVDSDTVRGDHTSINQEYLTFLELDVRRR